MLIKPKVVFVVTYGRSGSTLLMGILNSIPGSRVTGENLGVLIHLYRAYTHAQATKKRYGHQRRSTESAWYGADDIRLKAFWKKLWSAFCSDVLGTTGLERVIGFKEIRYGDHDLTETEFRSFIDFLLDQVPNSCIIVNTRDLQNTSKSAWHAEHQDSAEYLTRHDRRIRKLAVERPDRVAHVHHDDYVADNSKLIKELARIGLKIDPVRMAETLSRRHSFGKGVKRPVRKPKKRKQGRRVLDALASYVRRKV
jgi:hypothetical protein